MAQFCELFDTTGHYQLSTMFKSCGVADLIATGYGGRNRLCSAEFAKRHISMVTDNLYHTEECEICRSYGRIKSHKTVCALWQSIEKEMLHGQKLQGVSTCQEVIKYLQSDYLKRNPHEFPLFRSIHRIVEEGDCCHTLFHWDQLYHGAGRDAALVA
jgi:glycerol-3-phosphate dehydrogenase (NAD+)